MQKPRLLILDEPFNGLDLQTKKRVIDELENLNKQGTTILWSSHEINQLREMSDRYVFINCGKIVGHMQKCKKSIKQSITRILWNNTTLRYVKMFNFLKFEIRGFMSKKSTL